MADQKMKAFDAQGLAVLTNYVKQLKQTSDDTATDLSNLATQLADILSEVGGAIMQLDANKAYIAVSKDFTIVANDWVEDAATSEQYPYKYVLTLNGASTDTRADIIFDYLSAYYAGQCGISPISSTAENQIILRSYKKPEHNLTGTLYITRGKISTSDEEE